MPLRDDVLDALSEAKIFLGDHPAAANEGQSDAGPKTLYADRFLLALERRGLVIVPKLGRDPKRPRGR